MSCLITATYDDEATLGFCGTSLREAELESFTCGAQKVPPIEETEETGYHSFCGHNGVIKTTERFFKSINLDKTSQGREIGGKAQAVPWVLEGILFQCHGIQNGKYVNDKFHLHPWILLHTCGTFMPVGPLSTMHSPQKLWSISLG